MSHDDDVLLYSLYRNGRLVDEYNSCPAYWSGADQNDDLGFEVAPCRIGSPMTLAEVRATGAKTPGKLSAIPREGWEEYSADQLEQMERSLLNELTLAAGSEDRRAIRRQQKELSAALDSAKNGRRVFGVIWSDDGDVLFAATVSGNTSENHPGVGGSSGEN